MKLSRMNFANCMFTGNDNTIVYLINIVRLLWQILQAMSAALACLHGQMITPINNRECKY